MQEYPDDNQMDELFRKSAEAFEPDYDPTAWQDMAVRLDTYDRDHKPSVWLRRGLAVLLLVWLTGNYGWFSSSRPLEVRVAQPQQVTATLAAPATAERADNQPIETSTGAKKMASLTLPKPTINQESVRIVPQVTPGNQPATPNADPLAVSKTPRVRLATTPGTNPANAPIIRPDSHRANPEKRNREVAGRSTNWRDNKKNNALAFRLIQSIQTSGKAVKTTLPSRSNDATQLTAAMPVGDPTGPELLNNQAIALLMVRDKLANYGRNRLTDTGIESPIKEPSSDTSQAMPVVRPLRPLRFVVGAVFSPDLSTIGLRNFDRPGTNFGLSVQYQFSKRWSIQTGILQSQKNYRALASQYEFPPNVKWAVWPSSINADCQMLDLPLNVRYDVFQKPHQTGLFSSARWFVSAGATSYWIKRETYRYNYANPDDPAIKYRNWETSTGRQGISNLNLSVGYERQLNRRFSVQAEPFLKIPLRGIGAYKIRLISTGVFMSVRYRF